MNSANTAVSMTTKDLTAQVQAGSADALKELQRRVAKGSRFAIKAVKALGLPLAAQADATPAAQEQPLDTEEVLSALKSASGKTK